jgi:hypothetical protein
MGGAGGRALRRQWFDCVSVKNSARPRESGDPVCNTRRTEIVREILYTMTTLVTDESSYKCTGKSYSQYETVLRGDRVHHESQLAIKLVFAVAEWA